jgi:hypothetical protein
MVGGSPAIKALQINLYVVSEPVKASEATPAKTVFLVTKMEHLVLCSLLLEAGRHEKRLNTFVLKKLR